MFVETAQWLKLRHIECRALLFKMHHASYSYSKGTSWGSELESQDTLVAVNAKCMVSTMQLYAQHWH